MHTGLWEQVGPGAYETEREVLLDDQGLADAMISRGLGCSQISREKGSDSDKGREECTGWVETQLSHSCPPPRWSFSHRMAPNPKTLLCGPSSGLAVKRSRGSRQGPALTS